MFVTSDSPFGACTISTLSIVDPCISALNIPLSYFNPVSGLTTTKLGVLV